MGPLHERIHRTGGYAESIAGARDVPTNCCGAVQQIPTVSPLLPTSSPRGWQCLWSMMGPAFPQPACFSFFQLSAQRAIQSLDNYLMLAGLILPGLARAPWKRGCGESHSTALQLQPSSCAEGLQVLQTPKQLHHLITCLFQGCKVTISKKQRSWVIFLYFILLQTCFFFLHVLIKLPRTESARVHSKSIWPTVIVFFLPLIISSISLCSWYDWSLKLFVANSFLHSLSWYFSDCSDHCNPTYLQLGCLKHRQILPLVLPKNLMKGRNENLALIECFFKFLTIYD